MAGENQYNLFTAGEELFNMSILLNIMVMMFNNFV